MKFFRKITHVCQNCKNSNNKKGKWIKKFFGNIDLRENYNIDGTGYWHIFCEKRKKYYPWSKYKRCFDPKEWVKEDDKFN